MCNVNGAGKNDAIMIFYSSSFWHFKVSYFLTKKSFVAVNVVGVKLKALKPEKKKKDLDFKSKKRPLFFTSSLTLSEAQKQYKYQSKTSMDFNKQQQ